MREMSITIVLLLFFIYFHHIKEDHIQEHSSRNAVWLENPFYVCDENSFKKNAFNILHLWPVCQSSFVAMASQPTECDTKKSIWSLKLKWKKKKWERSSVPYEMMHAPQLGFEKDTTKCWQIEENRWFTMRTKCMLSSWPQKVAAPVASCDTVQTYSCDEISRCGICLLTLGCSAKWKVNFSSRFSCKFRNCVLS